MAKNKYDKMCYSQFVQHLIDSNIKYSEEKDVDIDYWEEEYIAVTPLESRLKPRYFSTDGGWQLF